MRASVALVLPFLAFFMVTAVMQAVSAEPLAPHLFRSRLDNGLTVIVKEIPGSRAATVQLWVKTGSVLEAPDEAGITHLIEHMIFKGTPSRGPGEVAGAIEDVGGRINAYTSYEYTVYHATLSSRHWQRALEVLADAVRHSLFDPGELEREKKVVLEEIGMRNDRPNIRLFQELMAQAYRVHPYRLPVIGSVASVSGFSREDILAYMDRHYQAGNFLVVVVGDVPEEAVLGRVRDLFGDLEPGGGSPSALPQEPPQSGPRFFRLADDVSQSHLALAFHTCAFADPDAAVLDVIAGILGNGESARLYHRVRDEKRLVYRIDASSFTPRDPGLMEVTATLEPDRWQPALEAILEEFFLLKYLPVEEAELDRVKRNVESEFVFNLERVEGQARVLGSFEFLTGDPREDAYLERIRAVRREDVVRVARRYFTTANLTAGILVPAAMDAAFDDTALGELAARAEAAARARVPSGLLADSYLSGLYRFRLANGMTLLVREEPSVPTVAIRAVFPGGLRAETDQTNGAFAFLAELLPKGTKDLSARELALEVADMAGEIAGFNGKNTFGLKADFLARFFVPGLELVRDVLLFPALDREEAEKVRAELLDQLRYQEDSLPAVAFREFNRILFAGHPYGLNTLGREEVLRHLSVEELRRIYQACARPDRLVLAVAGDVDAAAVREQVERLFGDWRAPGGEEAEVAEEVLPPVPPPVPKEYRIGRDREQVHVIIGFLGASLTDADRYPLEVLDTILSGQSGRLFVDLRDRQGLAYSLSSFSQFGIDTGAFGVYIGTSPEKRDQAIAALWEQIGRIRSEQVGPAELERAKNILVTNYELGLQTHSAQALEMALNETYGLGQDFGRRYSEAIAAVTAEDVLAVARRYLQPEHAVTVLVGAVAPEPKPAEPEPAAPEPAAPEPAVPEPAGNGEEQP